MAKQGDLDWGAIRQEYATTDLSLRKIAAKYGCAPTTVCKKAKRDNWAADRERVRDKRLSTTAEAQGAVLAEGMAQCVAVARKLLESIQRRVEHDDGLLSSEYKQLSGAIKDIRDILGSDLDVRKKQAEIEALRARTRTDTEGPSTVRVILGEAEQYAD